MGAEKLLWMISGQLMSTLSVDAVRGKFLERELLVWTFVSGRFLPVEAVLGQAPSVDALKLCHLVDRPVYRLVAGGKPIAMVGDFRWDAPAMAVRRDDAEDSVFYVDGVTGKIAAVRTNC